MLLAQTVLPDFVARYPEVEIDLVAQSEFVDIVAEGFDAGFRLGADVPLDMVAVRFGGMSRMVAVGTPGYFARRGLPQSPDDLGAHVCIRSRTPAGRPYKWEFEYEGNAIAVDVAGPLRFNRTELMLEAALRGVGIAFVPHMLAEPHLMAGRLQIVLEDWCPTYPGLFLYYPGHRQVRSSLRALIEVIRATPAAAFRMAP